MLAAKYWAIRCKTVCKTFYLKQPSTGWPYLTFTNRQAAQAWIDEHRIDGEPVRVKVKLEEAI